MINGDGTYSRDFTYIDNVIQANELAMITPKEIIVKQSGSYNMNLPLNASLDLVFNIAYGGNTTLLQLFDCLKMCIRDSTSSCITSNPALYSLPKTSTRVNTRDLPPVIQK